MSELVKRLLTSHNFRWNNEKDLQARIELLFLDKGVLFSREHPLGEHGVIDFLDGRTGIEVKISGQSGWIISVSEWTDRHEFLKIPQRWTDHLKAEKAKAEAEELAKVKARLAELEGTDE